MLCINCQHEAGDRHVCGMCRAVEFIKGTQLNSEHRSTVSVQSCPTLAELHTAVVQLVDMLAREGVNAADVNTDTADAGGMSLMLVRTTLTDDSVVYDLRAF